MEKKRKAIFRKRVSFFFGSEGERRIKPMGKGLTQFPQSWHRSWEPNKRNVNGFQLFDSTRPSLSLSGGKRVSAKCSLDAFAKILPVIIVFLVLTPHFRLKLELRGPLAINKGPLKLFRAENGPFLLPSFSLRRLNAVLKKIHFTESYTFFTLEQRF